MVMRNGLRASFKSIDLILKEGMNVKVVMFPQGEDPDSYSKKLSQEDFKIICLKILKILSNINLNY